MGTLYSALRSSPAPIGAFERAVAFVAGEPREKPWDIPGTTFCDGASRTRTFQPPLSSDLCSLRRNNLTARLLAPIFVPSRSPRASPETSQSRSGMRRPACTARNRAPGRRPGNTAHPPLRADRANASMRRSKGTAHVQRPKNRQAGSGPKNRRGGAPRGERPPAARIAKADPRGDARAYVTGPLKRVPPHPSACRRSASLIDVRETKANLGGFASREGWRVAASAARMLRAPARAGSAHVVKLGPVGIEDAPHQRMPDDADMTGPGLRAAMQLCHGVVPQCGSPSNDTNGSANNSEPRSSRRGRSTGASLPGSAPRSATAPTARHIRAARSRLHLGHGLIEHHAARR